MIGVVEAAVRRSDYVEVSGPWTRSDEVRRERWCRFDTRVLGWLDSVMPELAVALRATAVHGDSRVIQHAWKALSDEQLSRIHYTWGQAIFDQLNFAGTPREHKVARPAP